MREHFLFMHRVANKWEHVSFMHRVASKWGMRDETVWCCRSRLCNVLVSRTTGATVCGAPWPMLQSGWGWSTGLSQPKGVLAKADNQLILGLCILGQPGPTLLIRKPKWTAACSTTVRQRRGGKPPCEGHGVQTGSFNHQM